MRGGKKKATEKALPSPPSEKKTNPRNQGKEEEEKKDKDISYIQEAVSKERPEKEETCSLVPLMLCG